MASWEFPGSDPIDLDISLPSGSIAVAAEPTEVTTVSLLPCRPGKGADELIAQVRVEFDGGRLEISGPKKFGLRRGNSGLDLIVKAPAGSRCDVRTASSDVTCDGEFASLDARAASGDVTVAAVTGPVNLSTASGDVRLEEAGGEVSAKTVSGDFRLRRAGGDVTVNTASGDVQIGAANASASVRTVSGDVRIGRIAVGHADLNCVSGDISIAVAPGADVYLDLASISGSVSSDLDDCDETSAADLRVRCRTVSGDVRVIRAVPAQTR